jgi:hypothetical protein
MRDFRKDLMLAQRHIAQSKKLIEKQLERLAQGRLEGHDVKEGEKLLESLLTSLGAWEAHQRLALREIARTEIAEEPKRRPRAKKLVLTKRR